MVSWGCVGVPTGVREGVGVRGLWEGVRVGVRGCGTLLVWGVGVCVRVFVWGYVVVGACQRGERVGVRGRLFVRGACGRRCFGALRTWAVRVVGCV